ncbi:MAG: HNH endonuclease [Planctomycetes bacterium]|nr:HNH endonuclease [Planctomycetota bacterium]
MSSTHVSAEFRRLVRDRAYGCCEYCGISEKAAFAMHEVDHVVAEKHGGQTVASNLALCCTLCNRRKGSDLSSIDPETGEIANLFHPRKDIWSDHFRLEGALIRPLTPIGRATVHLLRLNAEARLTERAALRPGTG